MLGYAMLNEPCYVEQNLSWSKADDSLMDAVYKRDVVKVKSLVSRKRANPTKISPHLGLAAWDDFHNIGQLHPSLYYRLYSALVISVAD